MTVDLLRRGWPEIPRKTPVEKLTRSSHDARRFVLVIDPETTLGWEKRFLLSFWRSYRDGVCVEEGVVHADDLDPSAVEAIASWAASHEPDTDPTVSPLGGRHLVVMGLGTWLDARFYRIVHRRRGTLVGFNLRFDLPSLAVHPGIVRRSGPFEGGWTLGLKGHVGSKGWHDLDGCPSVRIRRVDRHSAFVELVALPAEDPDKRWEPDGSGQWRGRFVDLETSAYALSGNSHTLPSACADIGGFNYVKPPVTFGVVNEAMLDYARADVAATARLWETVREVEQRWQAGGIPLDLARLHSPAGVAAAISKGSRRRPFLEVASTFGEAREVSGIAAAASYAGRLEVRLTGEWAPISALDATGSYPAVAAAVGISDHLVADSYEVVDATDDLRRLIGEGDLIDRFSSARTWSEVGVTFALVDPNGAPFVHRGRHDPKSPYTTLGNGPLHTSEPGWWSAFDVAAAVVAGGEPIVIRALRLVPGGRQEGMRTITPPGAEPLRPADDIFRAYTAMRADARAAGDEVGAAMLRVAANAEAHGRPAQFVVSRLRPQPVDFDLWAGDDTPVKVRARRPEKPGAASFMGVSATVCAASRLLTHLVEAHVRAAGGEVVYVDTDAVWVVATPAGGTVAIAGRPTQALSFAEVEAVRARFAGLHPLGNGDSLFKVEHGSTGRQVRAFVVSPRRYVIVDEEGAVLKAAAHTIGAYRCPPGADRRRWVGEALRAAIAGEWDNPILAAPALVDETVTTPAVAKAWGALAGVRPFTFGVRATCSPPHRPDRRVPVACSIPGEAPERWAWVDRSTGLPLRVVGADVAVTDRDGDQFAFSTIADVVVGLGLVSSHRHTHEVISTQLERPDGGRYPPWRRPTWWRSRAVDGRWAGVCGKEVTDYDDGHDTATVFARTCEASGCSTLLGGDARRWCSDRCKKAGRREAGRSPSACCFDGCDHEARPGAFCSCCRADHDRIAHRRRKAAAQGGSDHPSGARCRTCKARYFGAIPSACEWCGDALTVSQSRKEPT